MRRLIGCFVLSLILLSSLVDCGQKGESTLERVGRTKVLRVGTDATYPPFETISIATGLIGELVARTYFESTGRRVYTVRHILRGRDVHRLAKETKGSRE